MLLNSPKIFFPKMITQEPLVNFQKSTISTALDSLHCHPWDFLWGEDLYAILRHNKSQVFIFISEVWVLLFLFLPSYVQEKVHLLPQLRYMIWNFPSPRCGMPLMYYTRFILKSVCLPHHRFGGLADHLLDMDITYLSGLFCHKIFLIVSS